ncbi:MFS transporter [Geobacter sulfurreducens]|uniref:Membrane protein, major facilitator superfamily n=1 Tax=Geobacter sulfurreducens (strain ATCC 51573 / DSM 12127 / PCA) TaxID=243231 RepID=Q74A99_GEOSL|nr:MFS transporter [Geobacter sulfurreducens]AAR35864.2 membrane protein, major facilitator superfamily [Geobacter sulfurreducens PCA]ADI85248.1 membrane protein, major facilitator superfamily [Geobacter sulfurreducens KN400]AJY68728.1 MFS transporter [Geobacter sulfurreducens]QVW34321.1 MFS transporter [Geobacter sulfurreducens]UAC03191.1 MFS transporter [Geobacter sulfurreducens]
MSDKTRWLLILCLAQIFIMLVFINYSAVLPLLKAEWGMNNTMAGSVFSVYQLGYIASGVILSALTDRLNTKRIFIGAALWSGTANLLFGLYAHDYASAMILRALTGIGMGGTYMPGLKLVAERFEPSKRGRAVGIYVGALVLGASLSLALTGAVATVAGWRVAILVCSAGVYLGAGLSLIVFQGYEQVRHVTSDQTFQKEIVRNKPAFLMILGYGSHMWEMYGMRSWLAPFFTASLVRQGIDQGAATGWAATAAAAIVGIGTFSTAITGTLSDRLGRTRTITLVMLGSASLSFLFGWLVNVSPYLAVAVGLVYGYLIVAESPVFSTGLTELVAPGYLGAAMGLQSLVGYSLGMISPTVFGWALDLCRGWEPFPGVSGEWGIAFATAGVGALTGPIFMWLLRRCPESSRMAGGRK